MITLLHFSDTQFGKNHRFGSTEPFDTLCQRLEDDLDGLRDRHGLHPDLIAVTGDLAEWGMGQELKDAQALLERLAKHLKLTHDRVAIVPGNHDINRKFCSGYFEDCEGAGKEPEPPFWRKWKPWAEMFQDFYKDHVDIFFTEDQFWTFYEIEPLKVVLAGLNSTIAESHRKEDHYGHLGEEQVRWFAEKIRPYRDREWLRIGLVHHNPIRGALNDDEHLKDFDNLERFLGPFLNVVLHGHTHDGKIHYLGRNVPIVSTGSAGLKRDQRPSEVPNQYQVLRFSHGSLIRYARYFAPDQKRWIGDTRFSETGDDWNVPYDVDFEKTAAALSGARKATASGRHVRSHVSGGKATELDDVDLILDVNCHWGSEEMRVEYGFSSPSGAVPSAPNKICRDTIKAPWTFREDLFNELTNLHQGMDSEGALLLSEEVQSNLEDIGHRLYERLLPQNAKDLYRDFREAARTLLVVSNDPWIPWELLKANDYDDDFFCLHFDMSRWLASALPAPALKCVNEFACIVVTELRNQPPLDGAIKEAHLFQELLSYPADVRGHALENPDYTKMASVLGNNLDLLHFAGYGEDAKVGTDMAKIEFSDRPFRVRQLYGPLGRRLKNRRPVVFINAGGASISGLGSWAEGWIELAGASVFVTPVWPVSDTSSYIFATAFYRALLAERKLAEAARIARQEVQEQRPNDISRLAYRVYGNPNARIVFGKIGS